MKLRVYRLPPSLPSPTRGGGACVTSSDTRPLDKLKRGGLHELRPEAYRDGPAALGFALAMIAEQAAGRRHSRDLVLWCLTKERRARMGTALWAGLARLRPRPCAFSHRRGEDGGRRRLGPGRRADEPGVERSLGASRDQGAARRPPSQPCGAGRAHALPLLSSHERPCLPGTLTRWRIAASSSGPTPFDVMAPGAPAWHLTLERCRGEAPGRSFIVEFSHESFRFHLSAASSDRAAEAGESARATNLFRLTGLWR